MSSVVIAGDTSGTVTLAAPAVAGTTTLTLPATNGTIVTTASPTFTGQATIPTINLTGGQIAFPSTQAASADANTLDDYEEGTFTPTFVGSATAGSCSYNAGQTTGAYVKIGQFVFTSFSISATSTHTGTGTVRISNLPFTISSASSWGGSPSIGYFSALATSVIYITGYADPGSNYINLQFAAASSGGSSNLTTAAVQNGTLLIGTFVYRASA